MKNISDIKILIVDDDKDLCDLLKTRFEIFNFKAKACYSGQEAWELLQENNFDIVVSDIGMKDGGGLELVERIFKTNKFTTNVFIITGFCDEAVVSLFDLGVHGVFEKPVDASQLFSAVRKSILPNSMRWAATANVEPKQHLTLDFSSLEDATNKCDLKLGAGGFSMLNKFKHSISLGASVGFRFNIEGGPVDLISGVGRIVWQQRGHLGIEINFIEPESLESFCRYIDSLKTKVFIPRP